MEEPDSMELALKPYRVDVTVKCTGSDALMFARTRNK
jgi:hypothetical protein